MCELRSHLDDEILTVLKFLFSLGHRFVDHSLEAWCIDRVDHIADPLLVLVVPPTLIRQVLCYVRFVSSILDEVINRQAFELRYNCDLDC